MRQYIHNAKRKFQPYKARNEVLKQLGFTSYSAYLDSELWSSIRERQLSIQTECFGCGSPANQIHHKFYSFGNLSGKNLNGLFSICSKCHQEIEFRPDGQKVCNEQANRWLFKIWKRNFPEQASKCRESIKRRRQRKKDKETICVPPLDTVGMTPSEA